MSTRNHYKDKILDSYQRKHGELPMLPMIQCDSRYDETYIKMVLNALKNGRKVSDEDYDKYFPSLEKEDGEYPDI